MKIKRFLLGIAGMALAVGLILAGCDNGSPSSPTKYTVTFDGGEGGGTPPGAQTVESGQSVTMPRVNSLTAPEGKEFNGWRGDGQTLEIGDSYTVTKDVIFTAQWKTAFVAVTGISGIPTTGTVGTEVTLNATVTPAAATNKTIVWSVKTPGAGVTAITGTSFTPTAAGSLTLTATIAGGTTADSPYSQDFSITVSQAAPTFTPSVNEATANNVATLGLVGTTATSSATTVATAEVTAGGKIKIASVSAGNAVITVSTTFGMSATIAVSVAADGSISIGTITPPSNPFIGVWIDSMEDAARKENYKFGADLVYATTSATTATSGDFTSRGTYEYNTTTNPPRLRLVPVGGGTPQIINYKIDKSTLVFNDETVLTKNPETGGGVNGSKAGTLAGIWKDTANVPEANKDVPMGFNGDGEYFEPLTQKSKDSKTWWFVVGNYEYDTALNSLTIYPDGGKPRTYTVTLLLQGKQMTLKYPDGKETTFEKQDF